MITKLHAVKLLRLFKLLTFSNLDFIIWLLFAFFFVLGFAAPFSFYLANLVILPYYYVSLLPKISGLLIGKYGKLLFSHTERQLALLLSFTLITLIPLAGMTLNSTSTIWQVMPMLVAINALCHLVAMLTTTKNGYVIVLLPIMVLIINPAWFLQLLQPYTTLLYSLVAMLSLIACGHYWHKASLHYVPQTSNLWWRVPKHQPSLAASLHFQHNASVTARLTTYSLLWFALPCLESLVNYLHYGNLLWRPENSWSPFRDLVFALPLIAWSQQMLLELGRLKKTWLYFGMGRNRLWGYFEHYYLRQLGLFCLPLLVLIYSLGVTAPQIFSYGLTVLVILLLVTYMMLCFPGQWGAFISYLVGITFSVSNWPQLVSTKTQIVIVLMLLLCTLLLRFYARKRWWQLDFSKVGASQGQKYV